MCRCLTEHDVKLIKRRARPSRGSLGVANVPEVSPLRGCCCLHHAITGRHGITSTNPSVTILSGRMMEQLMKPSKPDALVAGGRAICLHVQLIRKLRHLA